MQSRYIVFCEDYIYVFIIIIIIIDVLQMRYAHVWE